MCDKRLTTQEMQDSNYMMVTNTPMGPALSLIEREHDAIETKVLNELMIVDDAYRSYFKEWLKELDLQRMAAEKLWPLTESYCAQMSSMCREPETYDTYAEESIISKYQLHYQIILSSNMAMFRGISLIRATLLSFRHETNKLDLTVQTPFILGDAFHKPIKFFMDLCDELFNYFYSHYLKLDCGAHHLDPSDLTSLENYQKLLAPCEEFEEYLLHNLSYCQCLRPPQPCAQVRALLPKAMDVEVAQKRALKERCRHRFEKMATKGMEGMEIPVRPSVELEHHLRMNQLTEMLASLRGDNIMRNVSHEREIVQQMIYALSPSLM